MPASAGSTATASKPPNRATSLLTADAMPACSEGAELMAVAVRRDRDREPEPEHDDRRQNVQHVAGPGRSKHEHGQARTDHHGAGAQLQAGPDPSGKLS